MLIQNMRAKNIAVIVSGTGTKLDEKNTPYGIYGDMLRDILNWPAGYPDLKPKQLAGQLKKILGKPARLHGLKFRASTKLNQPVNLWTLRIKDGFTVNYAAVRLYGTTLSVTVIDENLAPMAIKGIHSALTGEMEVKSRC